jgi:hypothetical protein
MRTKIEPKSRVEFIQKYLGVAEHQILKVEKSEKTTLDPKRAKYNFYKVYVDFGTNFVVPIFKKKDEKYE